MPGIMRTLIRDCQASRKTIRVPIRDEARTIIRMEEQGPDYSELLRRIEAQREAVGISETQACLRAGLKKDCIRTIRRGNAPRAESLTALAKKSLGCPPSYLLEAIGVRTVGTDDEAPLREEDTETEVAEDFFAPGYVQVPFLRDRPGMGGAALGDPDDLGQPELMPERLITQELRGTPTDFLLMEVRGPSMSPVLENGDRVLIDTRMKNPAQPGIFVIHEGLGLVAKWVQHIQRSDPPSLKIASENQKFDPYTVTLEEAHIIGRVVWLARKL